VRDEGDYPERALYNWAREYSTALAEGGDYLDLPRTVIISIINFKLFNCEEYHSEYKALEVTRHYPLSDKLSLHFFELPKIPAELPAAGRLGKNDKLLLWLSLFKAETAEEMAKIEALEVADMNEAINAYKKITVSPEFQELERALSYARHNEAAALRHARQEGEAKGLKKGLAEGRAETARNLKSLGVSTDLITKSTGLSPEEIALIK
jgi:predicted transposase/invertase (TIGR01784 family)